MNKFKSYIIGAAAVLALGSLTGCQDHFDEPSIGQGPVATMTPNTSIAEIKEWMWNNDLNYCDTVYTRDYFLGKTADPWAGEHVIISGRVISSDYAGNCFKYIILQDETGALNFSINSYNLYLEYRRGQEIVVDLTGMFMGKYRGLEQVGFPSWASSLNGYETSFMGPEMFVRQRELNGMPMLAEIDTIEISSFSELGTSPSQLRQWQSQLIRINNVTFSQSSDAAAEGITTLSTYHSSGVSQTITDSSGATGTVRTSGYANFWNIELPSKPVDVVLLVGYYGSTESNAAYQFTLIDAQGIIYDATIPRGSKDNPYSIGEAIELQSNPATTTTAWVEGYLVGTVAPEVTTVNTSSDIEWSATPILGNTMVIGPTPDCTDVTKCLVIELPQNSAIYNYSILANPDNYGKQIAIRGTFQEVMGTFGVVTPGSTSDFMIDGEGGETPAGDGTEANPYTCAQVIAMAPSSTTDAVESGVWMSGYIVGYYDNYAGHFETTGAVKTNILMSDNPSASDVSQCVSVQLPIGAVRDALNIADTPSLLGQMVAVYGDVMKYNTLPGIKNTSKYAFGGDVPGGDNPSNPGGGSFSETFASSQGAFTIDNVSLPSALTYVWTHDTYGYMKASAYANNTSYASDSWLISPMLALGSSSALTFDHVTNKFPSLDVAKQQISVAVRPEGGSWQTVTIPGWSTNNDWTFVSSGSISLAAFAGKNVQIGFHYTSADGASGSWEVKNVVVTDATQTSGGSNPGGDTPGGDNPGGDTPGTGTAASETFTDAIGFPSGSSAAPSSPTTYTSKATGITYTLMGCYISTYQGSSYLMINGKNHAGAFISFSLTTPMSELKMTTTSGCSTNPASTVNVYANDNLIGNYPVNVQNATVSVAIPSQYQAAGTVYKVESNTTGYNQQFASFAYVSGTGGDTPGTDNPGGDNPGTDNPGTDNPGGDNPGNTPGDATTAVFDFAHPATLTPAYSATKGSLTDNGNTYENVTGVTFTNAGVSVTATKGNSTDARLYYQSSGAIQYRVYNGSTVTIASSQPISTIEFEFNNASSALTSGGVDYNKSNATVNANGATSVTFSAGVTVQINKITVVTK